MDGLLVLDKPSGPTSHDVVARMRRALREDRIGHTGTLDPMATGVLLLVLGKATRLARFLSASDKSYEAVVRLGFATDTADAQGRPLGPVSDCPIPTREAIDTALNAFRGTFMQQPPAFSAKKIAGQRSHALARRVTGLEPPHSLPAPASVTAHRIDVVSIEADTVRLTVDCSAGFYVRSLAHDLGQRLGIGAHLAALRRTRTGDFGLGQSVNLETAERDAGRGEAAVVPLAGLLPGMASVVLTAAGVNRVAHGRDLVANDTSSGAPFALDAEAWVRLLDPGGQLVAIARPQGPGLLHPSVVLM